MHGLVEAYSVWISAVHQDSREVRIWNIEVVSLFPVLLLQSSFPLLSSSLIFVTYFRLGASSVCPPITLYMRFLSSYTLGCCYYFNATFSFRIYFFKKSPPHFAHWNKTKENKSKTFSSSCKTKSKHNTLDTHITIFPSSYGFFLPPPRKIF